MACGAGADVLIRRRRLGAAHVAHRRLRDAWRLPEAALSPPETARCEVARLNHVRIVPQQLISAQLRAYMDAGFDTALVELPAPYDHQTIERLMLEVKPLVEAP